VSRGAARMGGVRMGRQGEATHRRASSGLSRFGRYGLARRGNATHRMAGVATPGNVWHGSARIGRHGNAERLVPCYGRAGVAGLAWLGGAWCGRCGEASSGPLGIVPQRSAWPAGPCLASQGVAG
jgi:hypothetical protein